MAVFLRIGVVERLTTDHAEPGAVDPAERLRGEREYERVIRPAVDVQIALADVGAPELLVVGAALIDLPHVDLDLVGRDLQAAHARPGHLARETQAQRVTRGRPGDVEPRLAAAAGRRIALTAELDPVEPYLEVERTGLSMR